MATASATWSGLSASATTGSAPISDNSACFESLRVMPTTWCPAAISCGTSCRPMAPVAPATKIFIWGLLSSIAPPKTRQPALL